MASWYLFIVLDGTALLWPLKAALVIVCSDAGSPTGFVSRMGVFDFDCL